MVQIRKNRQKLVASRIADAAVLRAGSAQVAVRMFAGIADMPAAKEDGP